jgi:hypothetical protein
MIEVLQSNRSGSEGKISAAELIITDARFNHWCGTVVKRTVRSLEKLSEIADPEPLEQCITAVDRFNQGGSLADLVSALEDINKRLKLLMLTPLN